MDQTVNCGYVPFEPKKILKKPKLFLTQCFCIITEYLWWKFQHNLTLLGEVRTQKTLKKVHFMDAESVRKALKVFNLTTTNAILMKLTTKMYLNKVFHFPKPWGVNNRAQKGINEKPVKMSQKRVFGPILDHFCNTTIKIVAYLMPYSTLHHWLIFQTILATSGGIMAKTPPKSSLKW